LERRSYVVADEVHLGDEKATERRHESGTLGGVVDDLVVGVQKLCARRQVARGSPATLSS